MGPDKNPQYHLEEAEDLNIMVNNGVKWAHNDVNKLS